MRSITARRENKKNGIEGSVISFTVLCNNTYKHIKSLINFKYFSSKFSSACTHRFLNFKKKNVCQCFADNLGKFADNYFAT